jgi:hypothetical protein
MARTFGGGGWDGKRIFYWSKDKVTSSKDKETE